MRSIFLLLWLVGCAHQAPTGTRAAAESGLDRAYHQVLSGERPSARGDGYVVEKTGQEGVRVVRETPIGGVGRDLSDAWITSMVKGRLGNGTSHVEVATDAGVVTLRGDVASQKEAMNAIRDTLRLDGVTGVDSQLSWPELRAKASTPPKM